jgi:hypothetical protein
MNKYPLWIPNLNAWMSAFLLIILDRGIGKFVEKFYIHNNFFGGNSHPKLQLFSLIFIIFLPILVITIAHHLIHIFLGLFSPSSRSREMRNHREYFPNLISWWEGLYGWQTLIFSSVIVIALELLFYVGSNYLLVWENLVNSWYDPTFFFNRIMITRLVVIACLYQFEYLVRTYLIAVGSENN